MHNFFLFLVESYDCEYCKGDLCNSNEIPVTSCDEQDIDSLPFNFTQTFNESIEACLHLEYMEDEKPYVVKQCYRLPESLDICDEIRLSLPNEVTLENCSVILDTNSSKELDLMNKLANTVTVLPVSASSTSLSTKLSSTSMSTQTLPTTQLTKESSTSPQPTISSTTNKAIDQTKFASSSTTSATASSQLTTSVKPLINPTDSSTTSPKALTTYSITTNATSKLTTQFVTARPTTIPLVTTTGHGGYANNVASLFLFVAALAIQVYFKHFYIFW
ncbi:hypothetical protein FQR65_LT01836 [Abscondita terminalis]|nr:hypothetical protein FQR65_LT01836 [Abscondita terminalis]